MDKIYVVMGQGFGDDEYAFEPCQPVHYTLRGARMHKRDILQENWDDHVKYGDELYYCTVRIEAFPVEF